MDRLTLEQVLAEPFELEVPVVVREYDPADRDAWHAGQLLDRVPQRERAKCLLRGRTDKYRNQCASNHYGEVLSMIDLAADGWDWLYDEYYPFWKKRAAHKSFTERLAWIKNRGGVYATGTARLMEAIGCEELELLWHAAERLRTEDFWPVEPDLFAWRASDGRTLYRAIEVKVHTDVLRDDQRLGLKLIKRVLDESCEIAVHHYVPRAG